MINYTEKGIYLHREVERQGYELYQLDNVWISNDDAAVQRIIDEFDPLPVCRSEAMELINQAAGEARLRYATDIPFQTEAYKIKYEDCAAFKLAGYPEQDIELYKYVNARAARFGVTGQVAADEIIAIRSFWDNKMFVIENTRDAGNEAVAACTDWTQCKAAAQGFIETLEAV